MNGVLVGILRVRMRMGWGGIHTDLIGDLELSLVVRVVWSPQ